MADLVDPHTLHCTVSAHRVVVPAEGVGDQKPGLPLHEKRRPFKGVCDLAQIVLDPGEQHMGAHHALEGPGPVVGRPGGGDSEILHHKMLVKG